MTRALFPPSPQMSYYLYWVVLMEHKWISTLNNYLQTLAYT